MSATAEVATASFPATRRRLDRDDLLMRGGICLLIGWLLVTLVLPLWWLLSKSFEDERGAFVGLANYVHYFSTPALFQSVWNSLLVSFVSTAIVLPLAFTYAYALQRTHMRWKGLFQALALIPILAPSLLPGDLVHLSLRQPGVPQRSDVRPRDLRVCRHRDLAGLLLLPARADDPRRRAVDGRRAALRGGGCAGRLQDAGVLHGHAARREIRRDQRGLRHLHARDHRLRHRQGDRRTIQRARDRHLQAGDRPAELRDGRGGRVRAADPGGVRVHRRPHHPAATGGAACRRAPCRSSRKPCRGATGVCSPSARSSAA